MIRQRFVVLSLAVLAVDQWSKWMVEIHLPAGAAHPLLPGLHLVHVRNTGVAFGLLADPSGSARWWLVAVGLTALVAVVVFFAVLQRPRPSVLLFLGLLTGGAGGNLLDRLFDVRGQGAVTDFLSLHPAGWSWPAFNVADAAIAVGLGLLAAEVLRGRTGLPTAPAREEPS